MNQNEAVTKILEIKVKYDDALQKIAEYNKKIDEAKVRQLTLNAQFKAGGLSSEEFAKQMEASNAVIRDYQGEVRTLRKELQNNITEQKNQEGSLVALRAELSNLTRKYDEMGKAERESAKGEELRQHIVRVTNELKSAAEETKRFFRNVGNYNEATVPLQKQLKDLTMQLAEMERNGLRGSDAYNEIAKQAGQLADNIADARAEIQHYASDTRLLDNTVNIITTASTAWQTYQGAVQAFGIESQEAMEAMEKLQGIIAMTNGLQQLHATFTDNSTASYKLLHGILRLVGLEKQKDAVSTTAQTVAETANTAATNANTASETANITATQGVTAANNAETVSLVATTGAMTAATIAGKVLRAVLMTLGIGLVVAALGALVSLAGDVIDFFFGTSEEAKHAAEMQEALNAAIDEGNKAYAKAAAEIDSYKSRLENFNGTKEQEKELVKELNDKYGKAMGYYDSAAQWKEVLTKNGAAYCQMLMKEAEAQALLNKYTEAFVTLQETQRKKASEFGNWTTTKAGDEERKRKAVAQADADAQYWLNEYKKKMQEAENIKFDFNFTTHEQPKTTTSGGSGSGKNNKADDQAKAEAAAQKRMLEEVRKAQDALNKLIEDNIDRRRAQINASYQNQLADLRKKLEEERKIYEANKGKNNTIAQASLTTMAALNEQMVALEKQKNKDIEALERDHMERMIRNRESYVKQRLELVKKGSEEELTLKQQQLNDEYQMELIALERSTMTEQEKNDMRIALAEKYYSDLDALNQQHQDDLLAKLKQEYENQINELLLKDDRTYEEQQRVLQLQAEEADKALEMLEERGQRENQTEEEFMAERLEARQAAAERHKAIVEYENQVEQTRMEAASQVTGGLIKLTAAIGEKDKEMAKLSKIITLAQIAIDTGKAISAGVASASSMPYPSNILAIASTVATVLANIATAISTVNSAKFAKGGVAGLVDGQIDDDKDRLMVRVNKGEMILNEQQQGRLFKALTGKKGDLTETAQQELFSIADGKVVAPVEKSNIQGGDEQGTVEPAKAVPAMPADEPKEEEQPSTTPEITKEQQDILNRMVTEKVEVALSDASEKMQVRVGTETITLTDEQRNNVRKAFADEMRVYEDALTKEVADEATGTSAFKDGLVINEVQKAATRAVTDGLTPIRQQPLDFKPITGAFAEIGGGAPVSSRSIFDTVAAESGMVDQMAETIENMPNPVVSVEDINDGQRRVEVIENIDTL